MDLFDSLKKDERGRFYGGLPTIAWIIIIVILIIVLLRLL